MLSTKEHILYQHTKPDRPPKPKPINPIEEAVKIWLNRLHNDSDGAIEVAVNRMISLVTPKRWVVYPPMVLLPPGSFGRDWWEFVGYDNTSEAMDELWELVLNGVARREGKGSLTHLAINSGIPLNKSTGPSSDEVPQIVLHAPEAENILRTPSGLVMLYGDFGPALPPEQTPSDEDLKKAFWVSTRQNGITQIWAPRYTMFSRGNVKEKARILDFHNSGGTLKTRNITKGKLATLSAVDLYAGIGYFIFSYVKMGLKQVVGWELNPWSVEGLRRGAVANGWSIKVVEDDDVSTGYEEQIVVFLRDNAEASETFRSMSPAAKESIMHVNCGLLPTSEMTWEMAIRVMRGDGWLHLHENVGAADIEARKSKIQEIFQELLKAETEKRTVSVEHVEMVKTFAPGVWHCVFDVLIRRAEASSY
ncbi:related to TRM12 tRNA methyltransferase, required for the formation of the hypermodified nucleoside wybutosine in the phenylalanine-accepting tRNA [Rhynchosporium secalis]|uniref:tRNA wybutosine-synthesizing protein 2 n=1 Tax=Rhynchosporium secalis TaxID=38038 RepID=A0A1E1MA05_RHYSE|nr:related to TRM12 tRNA methyltransferase, required for the formation of the hypermodified nucleoside wybutosine in the phenylalanine-accepting tRNA [Rhynchosporium secalis]